MPKLPRVRIVGEKYMATRGPKLRTALNSRPGASSEFIRLDREIAPTCELTPTGRREFDRLIAVLRSQGTLELVDMSGISDLARMADLLDQAIKAGNVKAIGVYQSHVRGLRRELGLTRQPSRTVSRVRPATRGICENGRWKGRLKLGD
jgi:hypothetical protein